MLSGTLITPVLSKYVNLHSALSDTNY